MLCDDIYFPGSRHRHDKLLSALGYPKRKHGTVEKFWLKIIVEDSGYKLVYVGETLIHTACISNSCQQSADIGDIVSSSNIVQRLSGGHAGTQYSFVLDAVLVCKASSTTGDYHKEANDLNLTKFTQSVTWQISAVHQRLLLITQFITWCRLTSPQLFNKKSRHSCIMSFPLYLR